VAAAQAARRTAEVRAALLAALQVLQGHVLTARERRGLKWVAEMLAATDAASYVLGLHICRSVLARLSALPAGEAASSLGPTWGALEEDRLGRALLLLSCWVGSKLAGGHGDLVPCGVVAAALEQPVHETAHLERAVLQLLNYNAYAGYQGLLLQLR
jgi:hypothetical protein